MRFGTDGVRGEANTELTPEFATLLGRATALVLGGPRVLVGRDTRRSGSLLEAAFAAGVCSEGIDVGLLGEVPTPAVAKLAALDGVPAAMVSASHNPFADNGIKLFAAGGTKLRDDVQERLEATIDSLAAGDHGTRRPSGADVGVIRHVEAVSVNRYEESVLTALGGRSLAGLRVVLDGANGAASALGPAVFSRAGAIVGAIGVSPDGVNINEACGSTHPAALCDAVRADGADVGFAFDGDADRLIAVDASGEVVDGDQLIAICALDMRARGELAADTVVVTVMTNLGFRRAMADHGIAVVETAVGDRHVLAALDEGGWSLGGEQSGHLIFRDLATTGDGVLSALMVADVIARTGRPLAELAAASMTRLPQILRNVRVERRPADLMERLAPSIDAESAALGADGRVLVRPSGTEPLVRVMVEAVDAATATAVAERLVAAVEAACP